MYPEKIDFFEERINDVTVIKAEGVINESNVYWLEIEFEELLKRNDYKVVINMDKLIFAGPVVWGLVLSQLWSLGEKGGGLKLAAMNNDMAGVFNDMQLSGIFEAYATQQEALSSFRAQ